MQLAPPTKCLLLGALPKVDALLHQQVAFDNADVCWRGPVPPDLVCPIRPQQNPAGRVHSISVRYAWEGGEECEGAFCLYANRGFAGGRGIAVITTEENYVRVKAAGNLLQKHDVAFKDPDSYPFHVAPIDGKGDGVVADTPLKRGDPIMGHTPVLLVHRAFVEDLPPESRQQTLLAAAVRALPLPTADLFMAQMAHIPAARRAAAILDTLAVQLRLGPGHADSSGHDHYGAFPEAAKLHHDCRPNAAFHVDPATLVHTTTAVRAIAPGEAITLSYLDALAPRADRQDAARRAWGVGCGCGQCGLAGAERAHSDTRLAEIAWIEGKLADYADHDAVSAELVSYLLGLYENEQLLCCVARAYTLAARTLNGLGHEAPAKMYAELAMDALKIEQGDGAAESSDLEALSKKPRRHWTWSNRLV